MCRTQWVLALVALCVGMAHSWDFAVTNGNQIEFYTNNNKTETVRFNSLSLAALVYDEVHNIMLFVDKQNDNDAICGYNMSSTQYKCFTVRKGRNIQGIAFDPATDLLFFTDTIERSINWISLTPGFENNPKENVLFKIEDGIPTDIAVDSCRGYIYWININLTTPTIERARFNGSERQVIINSTSVSINATYKLEPHSLAIDQQTQKIYWLEPMTKTDYYIYGADLNGNNKKVGVYNYKPGSTAYSKLTNALTVSKKSLYLAGWCPNCNIWEFSKETFGLDISYKGLFRLYKEEPAGIAANYKIEDQIQGVQECNALSNLLQNISETNKQLKIATEYEGPFCVHGTKVNRQSVCECAPGYTGERCDVSLCLNYCIQGNCSFNADGLPKCRCDAGFSGERCEEYACHGYCLNNGDCSLNEADEPVCQCAGNHVGSRCEADTDDTFTSTPTYYSAERNLTLADIFSGWRKPISKISVILESS